MKKIGITACCILLVSTGAAFPAGTQEAAGFSYRGYHKLRVDASVFDLVFIPGSSDRIELRESHIPSGYTLAHGIQGDRISIQLQRPMLSLPRWGASSARLTIAVPSDGIHITANTSSGSILIDRLNGSFTLTSTTGDIQALNSSGRITTRSTTGTQSIQSFSGNLLLRSTTGNVELEQIFGDIAVHTTSGSIHGTEIRLQQDPEFRTTTGTITMGLLNNVEQLGFRITTSTGTIVIGERRYGRGTVSIPGDGITVLASSTTGNQTYR